MRILLADDHSMFRSGLRRIISENHDQALIVEASSCPECLSLARSQHFDLMILDISMQGQNSLTILPELRKLLPNTPIIVLTMHNDRQFLVQALKQGAAAYLTKEHTDQELLAAIEASLAGKRYVSNLMADNLVEFLALASADLPHTTLSSREREVFDLLASGRTVSEIGNLLSLSVKTVSTYRTRILEKMGLGSNAELMRYAMRNKLIAQF